MYKIFYKSTVSHQRQLNTLQSSVTTTEQANGEARMS